MKKVSLLILLLIALNANSAFSGGDETPTYLTFSGRVYGYNTTLSVGESFSLKIRSIGTCKNYRYNTITGQYDYTSTLYNVVVDEKNTVTDARTGLYNDQNKVWGAQYSANGVKTRGLLPTLGYGFLGSLTGTFFGAAMMSQRGGEGWFGYMIDNVYWGASIGGPIGSTICVFAFGNNYRKGSALFMKAAIGAVVLPALAATYVSYKDKKMPRGEVAIMGLLSPISSTLIYYLFSKDKSDTLTPQKQ